MLVENRPGGSTASLDEIGLKPDGLGRLLGHRKKKVKERERRSRDENKDEISLVPSELCILSVFIKRPTFLNGLLCIIKSKISTFFISITININISAVKR